MSADTHYWAVRDGLADYDALVDRATDAILICNADPGPNLTLMMARQRARAVIAAIFFDGGTA